MLTLVRNITIVAIDNCQSYKNVDIVHLVIPLLCVDPTPTPSTPTVTVIATTQTALNHTDINGKSKCIKLHCIKSI